MLIVQNLPFRFPFILLSFSRLTPSHGNSILSITLFQIPGFQKNFVSFKCINVGEYLLQQVTGEVR